MDKKKKPSNKNITARLFFSLSIDKQWLLTE